MGYGVIGSTTDSGSVSLGSSPCTPALIARLFEVGRDSETSRLTGMVSSAAEEHWATRRQQLGPRCVAA